LAKARVYNYGQRTEWTALLSAAFACTCCIIITAQKREKKACEKKPWAECEEKEQAEPEARKEKRLVGRINWWGSGRRPFGEPLCVVAMGRNGG
jgi:hypothetical protein